MLYITFLAKRKGEKAAFIDNLANSIVLIVSISINLLIVIFLSPLHSHFIVFPFDLLMLVFFILFLPFFYFLIIREKRKIKKKVEIPPSKTQPLKKLPLKYDIYRKITHLVVLAIILFYFTIGFLVKNFFLYLLDFFPSFISILFHSIYNIEEDKMIFTQYLVLFLVGISLIGLLTADFVRILKPDIYPLKPVNQILREKELYHTRLGPQISMVVGCFSVIILFGLFQPIGPLIICTAMTMSIFGDIASNLIGRTIGFKYKNIRDTKKTYIGLLAGMIISFISGLLILIILGSFFMLNILMLILIPLIGSITIGVIDYLDFEIDDNLSFNLITTTVLFFFCLFFFNENIKVFL